MEEPIIISDDMDLNKAFEVVLSIRSLPEVSTEIAKLVYNRSLSEESLKEILRRHQLKSITDLKDEMLDLILVYINIILNDNKLSQKELANVKLLKTVFKIRERDFYRYRHQEIKEILYKQLARIYRDDNKIDDSEALYKVELQELFSLGYDQFLEFANREDILALERGADVRNLDTVIAPAKYSLIEGEVSNNMIPKEVKELVFARDSGRCALCQSDENLDYVHIIPLTKGGSNTSRNIQLACRQCRDNNEYTEFS